MRTISITRLYDQLSAKVGRETAEQFTCFVEEKINDTFAGKMEVFATKQDLSDLRAELVGMIGNTKAELIKWIIVFWAGQVITILGFILLFLKK